MKTMYQIIKEGLDQAEFHRDFETRHNNADGKAFFEGEVRAYRRMLARLIEIQEKQRNEM